MPVLKKDSACGVCVMDCQVMQLCTQVTMDEQEVVMPADDDDGYGDDDDQAAADAAAAKASKQEAKQAKQAFQAEQAEQAEQAGKTAAENKAKAASEEEAAQIRKGGLDAKAKRLAVAREHAYVSKRDADQAAEAKAVAAPEAMSDEERAAAALQRLRRMVLEILMRMKGKMYLLNGTLQQKGCESLGHLAATEAGIVPEMIKLGALPVVITSMTAYPRAVTVQVYYLFHTGFGNLLLCCAACWDSRVQGDADCSR